MCDSHLMLGKTTLVRLTQSVLVRSGQMTHQVKALDETNPLIVKRRQTEAKIRRGTSATDTNLPYLISAGQSTLSTYTVNIEHPQMVQKIHQIAYQAISDDGDCGSTFHWIQKILKHHVSDDLHLVSM